MRILRDIKENIDAQKQWVLLMRHRENEKQKKKKVNPEQNVFG